MNYLRLLLYPVYTLSIQKIFLLIKKQFHSKPQKITEEVKIKNGPAKNLKIRLNNGQEKSFIEMKNGEYESFLEHEKLKNLNFENKIVWDIGAHIGYQSLCFANLTKPNGKVYAFEPSPNNFDNLTSNIFINRDALDNIEAFNYALGDKTQKTSFWVSKSKNDSTTMGGYLSHVTPAESKSAYKNFQLIDIETFTIDYLLGTTKFILPDIIKIDVEGAELLVLLGAVELLKSNKKPVLIIEIHSILLMFEINNLLKNMGYQIEILDSESPFFTKNIIAYT
jgi:FkbM family methyltransferase